MARITDADPEGLLAAKVHPERLGDLIVRVGSYNMFCADEP